MSKIICLFCFRATRRQHYVHTPFSISQMQRVREMARFHHVVRHIGILWRMVKMEHKIIWCIFHSVATWHLGCQRDDVTGNASQSSHKTSNINFLSSILYLYVFKAINQSNKIIMFYKRLQTLMLFHILWCALCCSLRISSLCCSSISNARERNEMRHEFIWISWHVHKIIIDAFELAIFAWCTMISIVRLLAKQSLVAAIWIRGTRDAFDLIS